MAGTLLREVTDELTNCQNGEGRLVPIARFERWRDSEDIHVLGATYAFLSDSSCVARITPSPSNAEVHAFLRKYFTRCLLEDPKSEWADSRYGAGWDVARWMLKWQADHSVQRELLIEWKEWLSEVYRHGDDAIKECIETATLEHLLEDRGMAVLFSDWRTSAELRGAYDRCLKGPAGYLADDPEE